MEHFNKKIPPESAKALAAYNAYEGLGEGRTYAKVAAKYSKSASYVGQIQRWASWYGWQERILAWEQAQLDTRRKKRQADQQKMDEEHAAIGHAYLIRAMARLDELMKAGELPAAVALSLFEKSYLMERTARGSAIKIEASGPDGGHIPISGQVGFYPVLLPQKDAPPEISSGDEP